MGPLGIVLFVFALLTSIVLHEAGHMVCARRSGGKVTEFFVGFGPKIWSFRRGETEYGVKAIPAGGYVKIIGMTDLEPVAPEDEDRAFYKKPLKNRLITLSAGSIVHFLIALFLLMLVPMTFGNQQQNLDGTIGSITACLRTTSGACQPGDPLSPAGKAGLQAGDKIVAIDGKPVSSWQNVTDALSGSKVGTTVNLTVLRDGKQLPIPVTPEKGNKAIGDAAPVLGPMIGIQAPAAYQQRLNPIAAIGNGFSMFGTYAKGSVQGLIEIPKSIPKLFVQTTESNKPRSTDTPVGVVGMAQLSGGVIQNGGYGSFLGFIAGINIFIGIFNLLPILPLDGGHIAIALYERVRTRLASFRNRPDPGRVDLNKMMPVAFAFLTVFIGLSLLLMAADITNPLKFPS